MKIKARLAKLRRLHMSSEDDDTKYYALEVEEENGHIRVFRMPMFCYPGSEDGYDDDDKAQELICEIIMRINEYGV